MGVDAAPLAGQADRRTDGAIAPVDVCALGQPKLDQVADSLGSARIVTLIGGIGAQASFRQGLPRRLAGLGDQQD